jgi:hypothetical protein
VRLDEPLTALALRARLRLRRAGCAILQNTPLSGGAATAGSGEWKGPFALAAGLCLLSAWTESSGPQLHA